MLSLLADANNICDLADIFIRASPIARSAGPSIRRSDEAIDGTEKMGVFFVHASNPTNPEKMSKFEHQEALMWGFLERVSLMMMEDYTGDTNKISVDDIKLIMLEVVRTKYGPVKKLAGPVNDLPFRTRFFFNEHFTDTRRAYHFFCPQNMENGIEWMRENVWKKISGGFDILDWCGNGTLAHIDTINAKYMHNTSRNEI